MSENLLKLFPKKQILPYDGMSITAQVWNTAHEFHSQSQGAHNRLLHGYGTVWGLKVIASDPPDRMVYITPGAAIDPNGQMIVLSEPVAYDLGDEFEGALYLLISHRQSKIAPSEGAESGAASFLQKEFLVSARSSLPETPYIELARFNLADRKAALRDAENFEHPKVNEIDLRYRPQVQVNTEQLLSAAVIYLGEMKEKTYGAGLVKLSREIRRYTPYRLVVADDVALDPGVLGFDILVIVGRGKVKISAAQLKGLQGYLERGGGLLLEALDDAANTAFIDLADQIGVELSPVKTGDILLETPFLFAAPPPGFEKQTDIRFARQSPGGLVLCNANYGNLWTGQANGRIPDRTEIRSAMEFGANLLEFFADRRQQAALS